MNSRIAVILADLYQSGVDFGLNNKQKKDVMTVSKASQEISDIIKGGQKTPKVLHK